ncbi:MAG: APC family permease [Candidatus Baltobacteraceae bacterium]
MLYEEARVAAVPEQKLHRSLGLADVALFFIITGSNLQWVATSAAAGPSSLVVWVIGCLVMFVPLAVVVVDLSSRHPEEGGLYIWTKLAFGPFAGFITGWTYWTSNLPYFPALLYFTAGNALFIGGSNGGSLQTAPLYFAAVSLAGLTLGTVVNIFGLDIGKWLNNVGAISRWVIALLLIGLGAVALWKFGPATTINAQTLRPGFQIKDVIFWSVIAFAWTGPESLSFMAGEVKNPRRSIPLGLAISAPVTAAVYILGTAALLVILNSGVVDQSSGVMQAIGHIAGRLGWSILTPFAAILVVVSCLGSVGAWLGTVARIPFVAGIDHYLPKSFGRMHPKWNSPVAALVWQSAIAAVFILLSQGGTTVKGAYEVLVSTTVIITLLPFALLFASAIKMAAEAVDPAAIRIPGGKTTVVVVACVGLATTLCSAVLAGFPADDDPNKTLAVVKVIGLTALMVGSGIAVYAAGTRRKRMRQNAAI